MAFQNSMETPSGKRGLLGAAALRWVLALPPAWIGLVALLVIAWLLRPQLTSHMLLMAQLKQAAPLGVLIIGQAVVMRARSIDLSGSGIIIAVVYAVTVWRGEVATGTLLLGALLIGALVGLINGLIVTRLRASAVIVTLAMAIMLTGVTVALSQFRQPGATPDLLRAFGLTRVATVPASALLWFAILIPMVGLLRLTVFGRLLDLTGSNPVAAAMSGINVARIMLIAHVLSGLMAAMAALMLLSGSTDGSLNLGQGIVLNSIAGVVLGGATFGGGRGRLVGPAVGAIMLTFLYSVLSSFGLSAAEQSMVQGAIIGLAAALFVLRRA